MGFWLNVLGVRDYFDEKFEEFLKVVEEGFALRDGRIARLEHRQPVVNYQVVQRVDTEQLKKELKQELLEELKPTVVEPPKTAPVIEVPVVSVPAEEKSVVIKTYLSGLSALTHSEKRVFGVLLNSEMPLTYRDKARELGKSRKTVQTHILNMENKTDAIKYRESGDQTRLFYLDPEIRIKILSGKPLK
jgi:DNA-binding CsgD family transcriptional regulator